MYYCLSRQGQLQQWLHTWWQIYDCLPESRQEACCDRVCVCWCVYEKDRNMFFLNSPKKQEWTRKAQRQGVSLFILHLFFFTSPTSSRCVFMVQRAVGWLQVVVLRRGKQTEISCLYCLRKGKFTFLPFWFNKTVDGKKKKTKTLHFLLLLVFFFYLLHHSVSKWKIRFTSSTVS